MATARALVICEITDRMQRDLEAHFAPVHWPEISDKQGFLDRDGASVDYVLTDGHYGVAPEILEGLPNLRAVSSYGVGYDAIDTDATNARGVPVAHTPGVLSDEVATTALLLLLACYRNFEAHLANARSGDWATKGGPPLARSADNRNVGIVGLGRIGMSIASKLAPFHTHIHYHNRSARDVPYTYHADLLEMAKAVDALVCATPGGPETHHLVDARVMDALGPDGVLVNVGRGSVVDEQALIRALQDNRLGWAGLDVFENEPNIPDALRALPNTILTPHCASATVETRAAMGDLAVRNLVAHLKTGKLETPVPESAHL